MEKVDVNRIALSNLFYKNMQLVYESSKGQLELEESFDEVMKNNSSRMSFLIELFSKIDKTKLNKDIVEIFDDSIEMIYQFMSGAFRKNNLSIPEKRKLCDNLWKSGTFFNQ